jgi:acetyl-CoA acetyltransferase
MAEAFLRVLGEAGLTRDDVDGLAVSSFTLAPDHAIDLAWRLGLELRWIMEDTNGGACGMNMLQHAVRAIEVGDAETIVLLAGDAFDRASFRHLAENYNRATRAHLSRIPHGGPNSVFAHLTQRHMERHGLGRADYGRVVVAQRAWASLNPGATYRRPLTLDEYLAAPPVAPPLGRYDCVPVVSGADAMVVRAAGRGVRIRALAACHNPDQQESDGLRSGLARISDALWDSAGVGAGDLDVVSIYDDYPAMVLVQLADLGVVEGGDVARFVREGYGRRPINTSGGQLSAGQAGAGGGLHGCVEVVTQLLGRAGDRQVPGARLGLATGYGMVLYRYGACANAVVLERAGWD